MLATQNPVESESTFRLPAAQMDRFLIRISMGYPKPEEERQMLRSLGDAIPFERIQVVTSAEELVRAQKEIAAVACFRRRGRLYRRPDRRHPQPSSAGDGGQPPRQPRLYRAAKVWAAMEGRDYVTPDDVKALAHPVLEHRLVLESGARFSGVTAASVLEDVMEHLSAAPEVEMAAHEG